ncbi:MAG: ABC transporter ATP-binding protein [Sarcina sp.]
MELIKLSQINKSFGNKNNIEIVLKNIDMTIYNGEMIAIMGPSGSGKSTLMNIIGLIDKATSGSYLLEGTDISNKNDKELSKIRNQQIGFIFQNFNLISNYTLVDNVLIPLSYSKNKKNIKNRAINELAKVGLEKHLDKRISELSGGQKQRVAIARALVNNPKLILADEPTGSLDEKNGLEILDILKNLNKEGKTIIIVTHDINIAKKCDRILNIKDGIIELSKVPLLV